MLSEAGAEVVRERVDGAGPWCAGCPAPRRSLEEEGVDRVAVYPDLAGDSADGQLLGGEFSNKGLFFHSKQRVPPPFPLLRMSDRAVHFPGAGSGLFCRATDKLGGSEPLVAREDDLTALELEGVLPVPDNALELLAFLER